MQRVLGHISFASVPFILDDGEQKSETFRQGQRMPDDTYHIWNWELIRSKGSKTAYPCQAGVFMLEDKADR